MTDFTAQTTAGTPQRVHRAPRAEFYVYFAVIFTATLPLALLTWALSALRQQRIPSKGPVARAWSQARIITPMIFSA